MGSKTDGTQFYLISENESTWQRWPIGRKEPSFF